jgi:hypothetical protein
VPELPAGRRRSFKADFFQGLPAFTPEAAESPRFFPRDKARTALVVADIEVAAERIATFRPFAHHLEQPDSATYPPWGAGGEAHMTNLQTAALASGRFEAPMSGPDCDRVMSLRRGPDWLDGPLLEAGVVVPVPARRLNALETGAPTIPCGVPFREGDALQVLHRGLGEARTVVAGHSFLAATAGCNSAGMSVCPEDESMMIGATPREQTR